MTRERRANKRSHAAKTRRVAANWWQSATFRGFAARRLARKIVSMEALARHGARNRRASEEIRTPVQSLAAHSKATRVTDGASFDLKSDITKST
jgi:hypothetical protein